jgi:ribosome-binding factor A
MANRQGRIKAVIAKDIAEIVQRELKNPHIGMVSVNEVEVADDYSKAKVYVSFLGAQYPHQNFLELKKTTGYVRSSLAKMLDLYQVPEIVFVYDETYEKAAALDEALAREKAAIEAAKKGKK